MLEEWGGRVEGGYRGKNWENCNSIINKKYLKKGKNATEKKYISIKKNLDPDGFTYEYFIKYKNNPILNKLFQNLKGTLPSLLYVASITLKLKLERFYNIICTCIVHSKQVNSIFKKCTRMYLFPLFLLVNNFNLIIWVFVKFRKIL